MKTIDEQSNSEMSMLSPFTPVNIRICLVGEVAEDESCCEAARTFGVPVVTSETGLELINDYAWRTHFILKDFETALYSAIHKSKQCILGPPALIHAAAAKGDLKRNARPIYNYAMDGVVTCFTGVRKKDELTKLVNLIHSMGGGIRKDMNAQITHLISTHSSGDKYVYAKTFRLTVVRPAWVYAAWEQRDKPGFRANTEEFSSEHKLKAFEGQKICFFGFPADEHEHMVEVLESNGGIPAELDDPECSHVVMPKTGGHFSELFSLTTTDTAATTNISKNFQINPFPKQFHNFQNCPNQSIVEEMEVDNELEAENNNSNQGNKNNEEDKDEDDDDEVDDNFDERLAFDFEDNLKAYAAEKEAEDNLVSDLLNLDSENLENAFQLSHDLKITTLASTPKSSKVHVIRNDLKVSPFKKDTKCVLQEFRNISSIYVDTKDCTQSDSNKHRQVMDFSITTDIDDLDQKDEHHIPKKTLKRKCGNSDVSLTSGESSAMPSSNKKPKLSHIDSIKRTFKRSMSFVAERTPIAKMLSLRRSTVDTIMDDRLNFEEDEITEKDDDSPCSIASVQSTFNQSVRKPVKDKLRNFKNRLARSSGRKEKGAFNSINELSKKTVPDGLQAEKEEFKTPKAPKIMCDRASTLSASRKPLSTSAFKSRNTSVHFADSPCNSPSTSLSALASQNIGLGSTLSFNTLLTSPCTNVDTALSPGKQIYPIHREPNDTQDTKYPTLSVEIGEQIQNELLCVADQATTVVDEHATQVKPETRNQQTHILKSDWFWYTIQNGYAHEKEYLFGDYLHSIANTPNTDRRDSLPISFNNRKRKHFLQSEGSPSASKQRHSSDAHLLSVSSGSFFDCTSSPDKLETGIILNEPESSVCEETPAKKCSMRFNHFMEFYTTESNYVGILDTIVNLFKNPLEMSVKNNDALLSKSKIKAIFGNFLPIHEVHQSMLERLRAIHAKWSEDCLIGDIILQHRDDLIKAYPPYVNFFEQMKETLIQCDQEYPRFHAFLKINQIKPECGRQRLQDLMIRPVQRLPSVSLLLNDILKHTSKSNPDYLPLEEALKAIKEVTMHINEDKRKTESRIAIFDIFNDIEDCPAHLVSSNRMFISRCEVNELTNNLSGRGDSLMLYLFSDTIEVCKKRSRFNSAKSPGSTKTHKHVKLISLNAIYFVIDITDSPRAFALLCGHDKDNLYSFNIADEEVDKVIYLKALCKQMAENACRTDTNKPLLCRTSQELDVDISDINLSTLSKAFKLAARTRLKVGRAFSFNKTPSKLKRAVSTMMTPPFGSTSSLTPASQLAQMRLASCTNIHEVTQEDTCDDICNHSPAPRSVQPTRRIKFSTFGSVGRI
ncbi:protein ECT2 isoform X1 [Glossina fuscipes]|uniref:Protein ECT2 isoform X1 n=2 Tax=Glossina fuscipes TaxID=7396 RepID=A0A8U0W2U6_9MUSC|nr:protein ECT2 isoform X1 [Glossina fuscipes]